MPHINVSGVDLHYVDEGAGKPVFFLHGNAGSGRVWRKVTPEFKKRYRVIAHDRQGFGESEKKETGDFSPRGFAGELARLMDALGVERAHVCGLSMGGMIAQCFALDYPDRVDGLVLVGTMPDRTGRNVPETLAELERDGWPAVADRLVSTTGSGRAQMRRTSRRRMRSRSSRRKNSANSRSQRSGRSTSRRNSPASRRQRSS